MISQTELWRIGSLFLVKVTANILSGATQPTAVFVSLLAVAEDRKLLPSDWLFEFFRQTLLITFGPPAVLEPEKNLLNSLNGKDENSENFVREFYSWFFQPV